MADPYDVLKSIGLLLGVLGVWTAVEVYANGAHNAFGGRLAPLFGESSGGAQAQKLSTPKRAGAAVERAHEAQAKRYEDLLGD